MFEDDFLGTNILNLYYIYMIIYIKILNVNWDQNCVYIFLSGPTPFPKRGESASGISIDF